MIDEERLDEILGGLGCLVPNPNSVNKESMLLSSHEYSAKVCDCEMIELVALARLGLWADTRAFQAIAATLGNKLGWTETFRLNEVAMRELLEKRRR